MMNKTIMTLILAVAYCVGAQPQSFGGCFTTEGQYAVRGSANWVNLLRLDFSMPLAHGAGSIEAATIHAFKTHDPIVGDWQTFSNIETSNLAAAIAVLGYRHAWRNASLFVGVRNVNEDFFTSPLTSLFTNSSCGLFPTIAASYPIANYPFSGLTLYMDVGRAGWLFRNSVYNGVGTMAGTVTTTLSASVLPTMASSIFPNWSMPGAAAAIMWVLPSTPAAFPSTTMALWPMPTVRAAG